MAVNGQDFYNFATACIKQTDEISLRNAVGRVYYGIYHDVCSKLEKCPSPPTHTGVSDYLRDTAWLSGYEPFDKFKMIRLSVFLKSLHTQRKWADYSLNIELTKADAENAMNMAATAMSVSKQMYEEVYPQDDVSSETD